MLLERPETFRLNKFHPLANGLVFAGLGAHAGSTRYHDSSAFGKHGTLTGMDPALDWGRSIGRPVLQFNGNPDVVNTAVVAVSGSLTRCAWINVTSIYAGIIDDYNTSGSLGASFNVGAGAAHSRVAYYSASLAGWQTATTVVTNTGWRHVAVVVDAAVGGTFYLDGKADGTWSDTTSGLTASNIGLRIGNTYSNLWCTGKIADPCVYNRTLSQSEIAMLADPSNVMLSGLIQPPRRKWWPVVAGGTPPATAPIPVFMNQYRQRVA